MVIHRPDFVHGRSLRSGLLSGVSGGIERMLEDLEDAAVVDVLGAAARAENVACARRLAAMGELYARRCPEWDTDRARWAIDGFENVVAEIGAALGITRGRAGAQLDCAIALRDELPRVALADECDAVMPPRHHVRCKRSRADGHMLPVRAALRSTGRRAHLYTINNGTLAYGLVVVIGGCPTI